MLLIIMYIHFNSAMHTKTYTIEYIYLCKIDIQTSTKRSAYLQHTVSDIYNTKNQK